MNYEIKVALNKVEDIHKQIVDEDDMIVEPNFMVPLDVANVIDGSEGVSGVFPPS